MPDTNRTPLVSLAVGVVALAGVVGFAAGLPEGPASETEGGSSNEAAPTLPDELPSGLVAVDLGTAPAELAQQLGDVASVKTQQDSIVAGLDDLYGAASAMRIYFSEDPAALVQAVAVDEAAGPFLQTLPLDPATVGLARLPTEMVRRGEAVCSVTWGQEVPEGQPVDPTEVPQSVRCQQGGGGRTYDVLARGLDLDQTVAAVQDLAGSQDQ
ncbi:hypothetical protein [Nocardioides litoris]|uniref:hypothetical protein n=1 Tax=Nocardioides litoris TaxID=1926648 RepID=UPI0011213F0E|nr:hypothetical protein [Nocardioides litoris]